MKAWSEYLRSDEILLCGLIFFLVGVWIWTREVKLLEYAFGVVGALLGIIRGHTRQQNGNNPSQPTP